MVTQAATLNHPHGFHMRPAGLFATKMASFESSVTLSAHGTNVDGKSLMQIMSCGFTCGTEITVTCEGTDEADALAAAVQTIEAAA